MLQEKDPKANALKVGEDMWKNKNTVYFPLNDF